MEILRNFAVFEGPDGSGTTTQLNILETFFHPGQTSMDNSYVAEPKRAYYPAPPHALPVLYKTFEPTDGIIGKLIRAGLKKENILLPETIAWLFAADRNEHLYSKDGIVERCGRGELVVSDRYLPSSLVYQGITCGDELPTSLNKGFPGPELLIYFDIDPETAQERMAVREHKEIYENLNFQILVRQRYKTLLPVFSEQGVRVEIIDASAPMDEVSGEVWRAIQKMSIFKG